MKDMIPVTSVGVDSTTEDGDKSVTWINQAARAPGSRELGNVGGASTVSCAWAALAIIMAPARPMLPSLSCFEILSTFWRASIRRALPFSLIGHQRLRAAFQRIAAILYSIDRGGRRLGVLL